MQGFLSNLAHRQTDRQTNERGKTQLHVPPPLSEVNKYASCINYEVFESVVAQAYIQTDTNGLTTLGKTELAEKAKHL